MADRQAGFDFVDLFAGVGGFHAALSSLGGRAVQAAEIDPNAARVYASNWGLEPVRDVRWLAEDPLGRVADHAVLAGGFPCQPFSKSGRQLGIAEERGTLFYDILTILRVKTPPIVVLENVRNLAGPRQKSAWDLVLAGLRAAGYAVSDLPCVFSPHLLSPEEGGAPQVRERLYILGVFVGAHRAERTRLVPPVDNRPQNHWDPSDWSIADHVLLPEPIGSARQRYALTGDQVMWIDTWNELLARLGPHTRLPGFPLWEPTWRAHAAPMAGLPGWKKVFLQKNRAFYMENRRTIDQWRRANPQLKTFPLSRRKLEWQAQDAERDIWALLAQLRPSGIRVKKPTYAPALVAMNQSSIYGPQRRRLTPLEAARLQGFPADFDFGPQLDALSYKQMGNAVNVGAAAYVIRSFIRMNAELVEDSGEAGQSILRAVNSIDSGQDYARSHEKTA